MQDYWMESRLPRRVADGLEKGARWLKWKFLFSASQLWNLTSVELCDIKFKPPPKSFIFILSLAKLKSQIP